MSELFDQIFDLTSLAIFLAIFQMSPVATVTVTILWYWTTVVNGQGDETFGPEDDNFGYFLRTGERRSKS